MLMPTTLPAPTPSRRLDVAATADEAAHRCAAHLARVLSPLPGHPTVAFSGGSTPTVMFRHLAELISASTQPWWRNVEVFQVDERIAPDGDAARNAGPLTEALLDPTNTAPSRRQLMAVTTKRPAEDYERLLRRLAPTGLDVAVLGLGDDGHTASLVPGDAAVLEQTAWVTTTAPYRGHRRVTLTRPALDMAHLVVWLVTGTAKVEPLRRLLAGDRTIPAGLVAATKQIIFADEAAAGPGLS